MPRRPSGFKPDQFSAQRSDQDGWYRNGPDTAIPSRFDIRAEIAGVQVQLGAVTAPGGHVRVTWLAMMPRDPMGTITSTWVRRNLLVDELVRRAVDDLQVPWRSVPDAGPNVGQVPGDPADQAWASASRVPQRRAPTTELVTYAARLYREAIEAGSRSPTLAVANALDYSRSSASRLIRIARDAGLLSATTPGKARADAADTRPPVVAAIVTSPLGVLAGRRNDGTPPWTFIAGESWSNESPEDTAEREVKEETTLEVRIGQEIGRRVHPQTGRTMIYMAAEPVRGLDIFVGDEVELAEVRWLTLAEADQLLPGMYPAVRSHLEHALRPGGPGIFRDPAEPWPGTRSSSKEDQ